MTNPDVASMKIRDAFEQFKKHDVPTPATMCTYRTTLKMWEKLTDNPPVAEITNTTMSNFKDAVLDSGRRPATFNQYRACLLAILRRLGPQQYRNPLGEGLLSRIPYVKRGREELGEQRIASHDELNRVYVVCAKATWPITTVSAADWWRCALVIAYNCGPRRQDIFDLRNEDILIEAREIRFVARKTRKRQRVPMNAVVLAHIERIRDPFRDRLFPRGSASTPSNRQWHALQAAAGIEPQQHFGFHAIRRACGTAFADLAGIDVAQFITGHAPRSVFEKYYCGKLTRIADAADRLPQPPAFLSILTSGRDGRCGRTTQRCEWQFGIEVATFNGVRFELPTRLLAVLRVLVASSRPVTIEELREGVFWHESRTSRTTVKTTIKQLRDRLREVFALPAGVDPLPHTASHPDGLPTNGQDDGYLLWLPDTIRND